jgi:hypothetical protein
MDESNGDIASLGYGYDGYDDGHYDFVRDFPAFSVRRGGIQFKTRGPEVTVKTKDELMRERDRIAAELLNIEAKLDSRERYGEDPFHNGDMLKIQISFPGGGGTYTYAAVRARSKFYLTGRIQSTRTFLGSDDTAVTRGWTYDQLVSWLATAEDARVWRVAKVERVF